MPKGANDRLMSAHPRRLCQRDDGLRYAHSVSQEMLLSVDPAASRPLWVVTEGELQSWLAGQPAPVAAWVRAHGFQAERHRVLSLPSAEGGIGGAVAGLGALASAADLTLWHAAGLPDRLPAQAWHLATPLPPSAATRFLRGVAHGWLPHEPLPARRLGAAASRAGAAGRSRPRVRGCGGACDHAGARSHQHSRQ